MTSGFTSVTHKATNHKSLFHHKSIDRTIVENFKQSRQGVRNEPCKVNICFAVQDDGLISEEIFSKVIDFLDLVSNFATSDGNARIAAVQFSEKPIIALPLTSDRLQIIEVIDHFPRGGGIDSNINAALSSCNQMLEERRYDGNLIVLVSDGISSVGPDPSVISEEIRNNGTSTWAVARGGFSMKLLEDIVGAKDRVIQLDDIITLLEAVSTIESMSCGSSRT